MSGGAFDYKNNELAWELFPTQDVSYGLAKENHYQDRVRVAAINIMKDTVTSELVYDTLCLVNSLDYYKSGDIGEGQYFEDLKFFKRKWELPSITDATAVFKPGIRRFATCKVADEYTPLPVRGSTGSAGYDFYAAGDIVCPAHGISKLSFTNVKCYMPKDEYLAIHIRSSLAVKYGLQVAQGCAIIDSDYVDNGSNEGNIGIAIVNNSDKDCVIHKGERFCQGVFCKYYTTSDDECVTERSGGYGSTGKR